MENYIQINFVKSISKQDAESIFGGAIGILRNSGQHSYTFTKLANNNMDLYIKNPSGQERLSAEFTKDGSGHINGIKIINDPSIINLLSAVITPPEKVLELEKIKKATPHNMIEPKISAAPGQKGATDLEKLYDEIYKMIEKEYNKSKQEGKKFGLILCDKHYNILTTGNYLSDLTIEKDQKISAVVEIMALNAYKHITGNNNFLIEPTTNLKTDYETIFEYRGNDTNIHIDEVLGHAKHLGYKTKTIDQYLEKNPRQAAYATTDQGIALRDTGMKNEFNQQKDHFISIIGNGHAAGFQGMDYNNIINSNKLPTPDPSKGICSSTHHITYLLPITSDLIKYEKSEWKILDFVDKNSLHPTTCQNWSMRKFNGPAEATLFSELNKLLVSKNIGNAEASEKSAFKKLKDFLSQNIKQSDHVIETDLVNIAEVLSKKGVQLQSSEYKKALDQLAADYQKLAEFSGQKNSPATKMITDKIRSF